MRENECVQMTPEWWSARRGVPTASAFDQIMTPKKRTASASQTRYIAQLIGDITNLNPNYFTGQGGPVNRAVEYGRQTEDEARRFYEMRTGCKVRQVGFCMDDTGRIGCSPDGAVDPEGLLECKCPDRHTHMLYLMQDKVPLEYLCQCHGSLIVTGRKWIDFLSYCTGVEPLLKRIVPDDFTKALRVHIEMFLVKFEAAKKRFSLASREEEPLTDLTKQTVEEHTRQLLDLEAAIPDKGFQYAMDEVNRWIDDLKDKPGRPVVPYQTKREVWRAIEAFAKRQDPPWFFDTVNTKFRKEKAIAF